MTEIDEGYNNCHNQIKLILTIVEASDLGMQYHKHTTTKINESLVVSCSHLIVVAFPGARIKLKELHFSKPNTLNNNKHKKQLHLIDSVPA